MSTHTNGPWTVQEGGGEILAGPEDGFRPFDGCGCCHSPWVNGIDADQVKANAQLIAAAPELLEAMRSAEGLAVCCTSLDGYSREELYDMALASIGTYRAAIAKATGAVP